MNMAKNVNMKGESERHKRRKESKTCRHNNNGNNNNNKQQQQQQQQQHTWHLSTPVFAAVLDPSFPPCGFQVMADEAAAAPESPGGASAAASVAQSDLAGPLQPFLESVRPTLPAGTVKQNDRWLGWTKAACDRAGGPQQYLLARYSTTALRQSFADSLWSMFPPEETTTYHWSEALPFIRDEERSSAPAFHLHVAAFGFGAHCSTKTAPEVHVAHRLAEEIVTDGFVTAGENLLVNIALSGEHCTLQRPWPGSCTLGVQAVGYCKGQARMNTLLCMLSCAIDNGLCLGDVTPKIQQTVSRINCQAPYFASKREELFVNFKLSARGSIRKPPHVMTWVDSLMKLRKAGDADAGGIIKAWNQACR